ncbi:MAG: hypothetical protein ACOCWH_05575 [Spirochaetota bacterium]
MISAVLACILVAGGFGAAYAEPDDDYLAILKEYSPDGYYLASRTGSARYVFGDTIVTADPVSAYINKGSRLSVALSLPEAIHEATHHYTDIMGCKRLHESGSEAGPGRAYLYYTGGKSSVFVRLTPSYPFSLMRPAVPDHPATMRFSLLAQSSEAGHGVYELLDEWNAYLRSADLCLELLPLFWRLQDYDGIVSFYTIYGTLWTGMAEFRFYVLEYLVRASEEEQAIYRQMYTNGPLLHALRRIDSQTARHLDRYFRIKSTHARRLRSERISTVERDGLLVFTYPDGSSISVETQRDEYEFLLVLMNAKRYVKTSRSFGMLPSLPQYNSTVDGSAQ